MKRNFLNNKITPFNFGSFEKEYMLWTDNYYQPKKTVPQNVFKILGKTLISENLMRIAIVKEKNKTWTYCFINFTKMLDYERLTLKSEYEFKGLKLKDGIYYTSEIPKHYQNNDFYYSRMADDKIYLPSPELHSNMNPSSSLDFYLCDLKRENSVLAYFVSSSSDSFRMKNSLIKFVKKKKKNKNKNKIKTKLINFFFFW